MNGCGQMSELSISYKVPIMFIWSIFYLHLLIGLISSENYWRVKETSVPVLKGVIQVKFYFYEILTKTQSKEKRMNFLKTYKTRYRGNIWF